MEAFSSLGPIMSIKNTWVHCIFKPAMPDVLYFQGAWAPAEILLEGDIDHFSVRRRRERIFFVLRAAVDF